jgi:hypothetical protein
MPDRDFSQPTAQAVLTLKDPPRHRQLSRLLPCGTLGPKRGRLQCAVYLKRSRAGSAQLREILQSLNPRSGGAARTRSRRGSFLRLANSRSH